MWNTYQKKVVSVNEKIRLTRLLSELYQNRLAIIEQQGQGVDMSYMILQTANRLNDFAQTAGKPDIASLALIKYADAIRMELHYRMGGTDNQTVSSQIAKAKTAYQQAAEKASDNASLRATATFGLGLCEEELQNFDKAKEIYKQIVDEPEFETTIAKASAQHRLKIMDDYRQMVAFKTPPIVIQPDTQPVPLMDMLDTNAIEFIPADQNQAVQQ
jgi:tetratricopeptide (TPR) repeat protein